MKEMRKFKMQNLRVNCLLLTVLILLINAAGCKEQGAENPPDKQPVAEATPKEEPQARQQEEQEEPVSEKEITTELIGEYTTQIFDKLKDRTANLNLAADALNGYIVNPGAQFSFNEIVGPRSKEKGYKKAIAFDENGEKTKVYGGGICQVSSTLHMAARKAEMNITERHTHKQEVPYIEAGSDAAISYGGQDFKFINNTEYKVKINVEINGMDSVTARLYKIP